MSRRDWKRVQRELDETLPNGGEGSDVHRGRRQVTGRDDDASILEHIAEALRRDGPEQS